MQIRKHDNSNNRKRDDLMPLREVMDQLFNESFWSPMEHFSQSGGRFPAVDISETTEAIEIKANVPGIDPSNIEIELDKDILTIRGESKEEEKEEGERFYRSERRYGKFERSFRIPDTVEKDRVSAKTKNGVLRITLPKLEEEKSGTTKIEVEPEE